MGRELSVKAPLHTAASSSSLLRLLLHLQKAPPYHEKGEIEKKKQFPSFSLSFSAYQSASLYTDLTSCVVNWTIIALKKLHSDVVIGSDVIQHLAFHAANARDPPPLPFPSTKQYRCSTHDSRRKPTSSSSNSVFQFGFFVFYSYGGLVLVSL